jgi:Tfp pilus assembly protein PilO
MEQPTKTSRLEQTTGLILLGIIVIIIMIFWVIKPQMNSLKDANAKVKAKTTELSKKQQMLENMNVLESQIKSNSKLVSKLNIVLPYSSPGASGLVMQLETMAKATGVSMKSLTPLANESKVNYDEPAAALNIQTYRFTFNAVGSYSNIKSFFTKIEKNLRPISIKNINLSSAENGADPEISAQVDAETYYSM